MRLHRLSTVYLPKDAVPSALRGWQLEFATVIVRTMQSWEVGEQLRLLLRATVSIPLPDLKDGKIVIPEGPRTRCEQAIEVAANVLAVARRCHRAIRSPHPALALEPETETEAKWLVEQTAIHCVRWTRASVPVPVDIAVAGSMLAGRLDGVFLMAEALAQDHASGRFHEFIRLFERAFARSSVHLAKPLSTFLTGTPFNFARREIDNWVVKIRHSLTHADEQKGLAFEADSRRVIGRMEDAAYDVLFSKADWRNPSTARRDVLPHLAGTSGPNANLFVTEGHGTQLLFTLVDAFGSFPLDFSASITNLPETWWARLHDEDLASGDFEVKERSTAPDKTDV